MTWPEGPMQGWCFWGGAAQLGGLGRAVTTPTPPQKMDLHESCGHACRPWGCVPPCARYGYATEPMLSNDSVLNKKGT